MCFEVECFCWCRLPAGRPIIGSDTSRPCFSFDGSGAKGGVSAAFLNGRFPGGSVHLQHLRILEALNKTGPLHSLAAAGRTPAGDKFSQAQAVNSCRREKIKVICKIYRLPSGSLANLSSDQPCSSWLDHSKKPECWLQRSCSALWRLKLACA